ncbi:ethanolamine utilization protein EutH [Ornithinibacillus halophilus]|uniref:Ethanolamine transporter n=1 Tax=Ornithinibacillus halophilus TaxID=930117 RepID=A0A1M5G8Y3_9BACI|nr:ethanolamine utilization protein EutH [Ornithinibacillus halophilus]SHG00205.1 ethanolamine transporter [Ornithinibacillus halophilus]
MGINDIIIIIIVVFLCVGGIDYLIGNKFGLGEQFADGFNAMGPLTLAMVGIISIAPVLATFITPIVVPVYAWFGADPAAFANTILAIDMGGYALATEMSLSEEAELFSWIFLGTMMGPTIVFTIPVALGIIKKEDHAFFAKGILIGLITVPIGCFLGGLVAQFDTVMMIRNLLPTILFSVGIAIGLWLIPDSMIKGFKVFAKAIQIIAIVGLIAIIIETLTGFVVIANMTPLDEGIVIVGRIVLFLAGAFPLVTFIRKAFKSPLERVGSVMGMDKNAVAGIAASLAHVIPMFVLFKDMGNRGKVICVAFAVSGGFVLGSHLGFVAGIEKDMIFALIIGKLAGGISAVFLALITTSKTETNG